MEIIHVLRKFCPRPGRRRRSPIKNEPTPMSKPLMKPNPAPRVAAVPDASAPALQLSVPIGPRVIDVLDAAYRARRPVLLEGSTGIGKSQIVAEFARSRGLGFSVLDLSLLEPPDLV